MTLRPIQDSQYENEGPLARQLREATDALKRHATYVKVATWVSLFIWPLLVFVFNHFVSGALEKIEQHSVAIGRVSDLERMLDGQQSKLDGLTVSALASEKALARLDDVPANIVAIANQAKLSSDAIKSSFTNVDTRLSELSAQHSKLSQSFGVQATLLKATAEDFTAAMPKLIELRADLDQSNAELKKFLSEFNTLANDVRRIDQHITTRGKYSFRFDISAFLKKEFVNGDIPGVFSISIPIDAINTSRKIVGVESIEWFVGGPRFAAYSPTGATARPNLLPGARPSLGTGTRPGATPAIDFGSRPGSKAIQSRVDQDDSVNVSPLADVSIEATIEDGKILVIEITAPRGGTRDSEFLLSEDVKSVLMRENVFLGLEFVTVEKRD